MCSMELYCRRFVKFFLLPCQHMLHLCGLLQRFLPWKYPVSTWRPNQRANESTNKTNHESKWQTKLLPPLRLIWPASSSYNVLNYNARGRIIKLSCRLPTPRQLVGHLDRLIRSTERLLMSPDRARKEGEKTTRRDHHNQTDFLSLGQNQRIIQRSNWHLKQLGPFWFQWKARFALQK